MKNLYFEEEPAVEDIGCGGSFVRDGKLFVITCGHRLVSAGYHYEWCPSFRQLPKPQGQSVDEWIYDTGGDNT